MLPVNHKVYLHLAAMLTVARICAVRSEKREVHLIVPADITGQIKVWNVFGKMVHMAFRDIENRGDILPNFTLVPHYVDSQMCMQCLRGPGIDAMYSELYTVPPKPVIIGPTCSTVCKAMGEVSILWNISQITNVCVDPALSDKKLYPRFFRTSSSDDEIIPTRLALLRHFGWEKVALFQEPAGPFPLVTQYTVQALRKTTVRILSIETIGNNPRQQIQSLMSHDARIIMGGTYPAIIPHFFCEAYKLGFYGAHITWMLPGYYDYEWYAKFPESHDCQEEEILEAVQDILYMESSWKSLTDEPSITGIKQSQVDEWVEQWQANGTEKAGIPFAAASYYDSVMASALALHYAQEKLEVRGYNRSIADFRYEDIEMADLITEGFKQVKFQGIKGSVQFNQFGNMEADAIIYQQKGREKRIVGWHKRSLDKIEWLNGGITWRNGEPPADGTTVILKTKFVSPPLYIAVCCISGLGILLNIYFISFNFYYRKLRVIKMSSPNINTLILVGCIVAYSSVFFEVGESTTSIGGIVCSLRTAVFVVGFSLALGGLFSKTWRVHVILTRSTKTAKRTIISDTKLFMIVGFLVLVDLVVIATWQIYDPYHLKFSNLTEEISKETLYKESVVIHQIPRCSSQYKTYFEGALFIIQGAMLAFGAFLAWETRKVKLAALNDSKLIGVCIYNVTILSIIGAAISMVMTENPDAGYGFASAFLILGTAVVSTVLFVPKVMTKHRGDVEPIEETMTGTERSTIHTREQPLKSVSLRVEKR